MAQEKVVDAAATAEPVDVVKGVTSLMDPDNTSQLLQAGMDLLMQYGPKLLAAIVIFYVGKLLSKWLKRLVTRMMTRASVR